MERLPHIILSRHANSPMFTTLSAITKKLYALETRTLACDSMGVKTTLVFGNRKIKIESLFELKIIH